MVKPNPLQGGGGGGGGEGGEYGHLLEQHILAKAKYFNPILDNQIKSLRVYNRMK